MSEAQVQTEVTESEASAALFTGLMDTAVINIADGITKLRKAGSVALLHSETFNDPILLTRWSDMIATSTPLPAKKASDWVVAFGPLFVSGTEVKYNPDRKAENYQHDRILAHSALDHAIEAAG